MIRLIARICRSFMRLLTTERTRVHVIEKMLRGALLVPIFGGALVLLRIRMQFIGPTMVEGTTRIGGKFRCGLPDIIQMYLFYFGIWEPDITAWMQRRLEPGSTYIDVGANIGYHAVLAAKCVGESGRVIAIEASPRITQELNETLHMNNLARRVRVVNRAASDMCGTVKLYSGPTHNIGRTTMVESLGFPAREEIEAAPLGDLLEPEEISGARLVKIDVEGVEDRVLAGMVAFLRECPHDVEILVELSPAWWSDKTRTPAQALRPILDLGFHAYRIPNNLWPWRYLWPNDVQPPQRIREPLTERVPRIDLVLSRIDADQLR